MTDTTADADPTAVDRLLIPYTFLWARLALSAVTLLLILLICAGFAGWGPGHALVSLTDKAFAWIDSWSGLGLS